MASKSKSSVESGPPVQKHGESHDVVINASGHEQVLERNFNLLSICSMGITVGCVWPALGGSLQIALYNGGPSGVIYEFLAVSFFYWNVAASIAELASAIPSSGGVYHWATITAGKYGRAVGFFAGYWNLFAWAFGAASMSSIIGSQGVQMYAVYHPEFSPSSWHVFVAYLIVTWCAAALVLFGNRILPYVNNLGSVFILGGFLVTVIICAAMPGHGGRPGHATSESVWRSWSSDLGYSSQGFVFCMGMLNGAFAVGTPDCTTHLAEEIPRPSVNIPRAILAQMSIGLTTGLIYLITVFYAINDLDKLEAATFPLAEIYSQATGSQSITVALLVLITLPLLVCLAGLYTTLGRTLWTLGRDGATPFPKFVSRISHRWENPFNATVVCAVFVTIMGCIYVGSTTAFNALVGSYVLLSSSSYVAAILPHLLSGRKNFMPGRFYMKGVVGYIVNAISCGYMIVFIVIYSFPVSLPTDASSMNYACLIHGGLTIFVALWWIFRARKGYEGPPVLDGVAAPEQTEVRVEDVQTTAKPVHI